MNAPCLYSKDGTRCYLKATKSGYCPKHEPPKWYNPNYQKPNNWNATVKAILQRDKYICYICANPGADSVDHIKPKSQGGTDNPINLKAIHDKTPPHCHKQKTLNEAQQAKQGRKPLKYGAKRPTIK